MGIYAKDVQALYVAYYNRPADPVGLAYWEKQLESGATTIATVAKLFGSTDEYKAAYAGQSTAQVINTIYVNLFGHNADTPGLLYWADLITSGKITLDVAVTTIAAGALTTDKVAYESKVAASVAFTDALVLKDGGTASYSGPEAAVVAKNYLAGVTDAASLAAATTNLPATLDAVASAADPLLAASQKAQAAVTAANTAAAGAVTKATEASAAVTAAQKAKVDADAKAALTDADALTAASTEAADTAAAAVTAKAAADQAVVDAKAELAAAIAAGDAAGASLAQGKILVAEAAVTTAAANVTSTAAAAATAKAVADAAVADDAAAVKAGAAIGTVVTAADAAAKAAVAAAADAAAKAAAFTAAAAATTQAADNVAAAAAAAAAAKAATDAAAASAVVTVITSAAAYATASTTAATDATAAADAKAATAAAIAAATSAEGAKAAIDAAAAEVAAAAKAKASADAAAALAVQYDAAAKATPDTSDDAAAAAVLTAANAAVSAANAAVKAADDSSTAAAALPGKFVAKTFTLTAGVDQGAAFTGGDAADVFVSNYDTINGKETLTALDSLNGGKGIDTLQITSDNGTTPWTMAKATLADIEIITIRGSDDVTADVSGANVTGLEKIAVTQSVDATVTGAATTAVEVSGATGVITVKGGKDVTVTDSTANNAITVSTGAATGNAAGAIKVTDSNQGSGVITVDGGTTVNVIASTDKASSGNIVVGANKAATGAVVVTQNITNDAAAAITAGNIAVTGGSTITVNKNLTNVATKDSGAANNIAAGSITVTGSGTTAVTITQTNVATDYAAVATGASKETSTVTFASLKSGEKIAISAGALTGLGTDLTFTASKDLTAAEVAAIFANLTAGDLQTSGGKVANGVFTGALDAGWTSGAVSGNSVTFTATTNGNQASEIAVTVKKADGTTDVDNAASFTIAKVDGSAGTSTTARDVTATNGNVVVNDGATAAITDVTINGYGTATIGTTAALTKLANLSLANSGGIATIDTDVGISSLNLTVNKVAHGVDISTNSSGVKSLAVTATGANSTFGLTAANVETLTVAGDKVLNIATGSTLTALKTVTVSGTAGLNIDMTGLVNQTSVNTTATTGTVTATIDASKATYTGGSGVDNVTLSTITVDKAIDTGAGNDTVTLAAGTTSLNANISGGAGTDTLVMNAADAVIASGGTTFETKIDGFEKLSLGVVAGGASGTVNLANMDDISYVISANTTVASAAQTETGTYTFGALLDGQALTLAGVTVRAVGANLTATQVAEAFDNAVNGATPTGGSANAIVTGTYSGWSAGDNGTGASVVFTSSTASTNVADLDTLDSAAGVAAKTAIVGVASDGGVGDEFSTFTMDGLLAGQSLTIAGVKIQATADMTAAEVVAAFVANNAGNVDGAKYFGTGTKTVPAGGWTAIDFSASGNDLIVTDTGGAANVTDFTASTGNSLVAAPSTGSQSAYTQGAAAGAVAAGALEISNMANNGTLELTGAGAGVTVTMKDATGSADIFNIVTKVDASNLDFGSVAVAGVETINITATDTSPITSGVATISKATLALSDSAAKTVNVVGESDLDLTLTAATAVTKVDATSFTGKLAVTAGNANMTVIGGAANDTLTANANDVKLYGNGGDDTFTVASGLRVNLYGGAGADTFVFNTGASATLDAYAVINGVGTGDVLKLAGATSFNQAAITLSVGADDTLLNYANQAVSVVGTHGMGWFQKGGNTYIVQDVDGNSTFDAASDMIIMITGQVDLSTASYNSSFNTLEIA